VFSSFLNGERRVGAIVPIPALGWAAHASRPLEAAMAPVRRAALVHAGVFLAVALGGLGGALFVGRRIARPLRALEWEAARLAHGGEPSPGVRGPVEVRRVAYALRSIASAVASRRATVAALTEERETLMQTVSHDLRTPLHVVVGHARLLQRQGQDPAVLRRADAILASAGRMTRLIGDLVDAARFEAGHVDLQLEPMDLASFLGGWRDRVAAGLHVERVRLEVPASVPAVLADPGRLDQILANLVSNALKYSIPGSEVRVTLTEAPPAAAPNVLRLAVSDVGPGIPSDELPRLFERYYRSKSAPHAEGLGLGLFITRKLVEAHGWRIHVQSELGKGSVFTVVIPVSGAPAARPSSSAVA
jgi:signal transduction histidine kinase